MFGSKVIKTTLSLAVIFWLAIGSALATDAYVATTGSGSACTSIAPCATILLASAVVTAGGTVYVSPGLYTFAAFTTTVAGTSGNIITYKCQAGPATAYSRGACIIMPAVGSGSNGTAWENDGAFVTIDGFQVDGRGLDGSTFRIGLYGSPTTAGAVTYQNNIVHHIFQVPTSICNSSGGAGIETDAFHSASAVVHAKGNYIHDIGSLIGCNTTHGIYWQTPGATISSNIVYNIAGWCYNQWHDGTTATVVNNTAAKCISGGITIGAGQWYKGAQGVANGNGAIATNAQTLTSSNVLHFAASATGLSTIVNGWGWYDETNSNASANCGPLTVSSVNVGAGTVTMSGNVCATVSSADLIDFGPLSNTNNVRYNISYDTPKGVLEYNATGAANVYDSNLLFSNPTSGYTLQNGLSATNQVSADPLFVDYASGSQINDFHLQAGSPARGGAAATNSPAIDFEGKVIPHGTTYDIGALAFLAPSPYFTMSAGQIGTTGAFQQSQLDIIGNGTGVDNSGGQIHFHSPAGTFFDKWVRLNDSSGALEITNSLGATVLALEDSGSLRLGQYANNHGNTGATCNGTNGLSAINGSGITQTCRYFFTGAGSTASSVIVLTTDGGAASAHNCANMPVNSGGTWSAQLHATDVGIRGRDWSWTMPNGAFFRDSASITISSGTPVITIDRGTVTGIAAAMTADTTNQCFHLAWTHPSSDSDLYNVSAYIDISEISP